MRKGELLGWCERLQSNFITVVLRSDDTVSQKPDMYEGGQC